MSKAISPSTSVAVIGAGTMGNGIAQVAATMGHTVYLHDPFPGACERGLATVRKNLDYLVRRNKMAADEADATAARIMIVDELNGVSDAGLVIEAIVENEQVKRELYAALEEIVSPNCILASNTSSISVTALAQGLKHPGRLVGMHFFNPAPRMPLVEVITGLATSPKAAQRVADTAKAWGKKAVFAKSTPGFIVNRVARPYYSEALRFLTERGGSPETLDAIMRECAGFVLGPCELMDLIGLDVNLSVTQSVFEAMAYDSRYAPSLLQQELVRAGRHGRKTSIGFYDYRDGATKAELQTEALADPPDTICISIDSNRLQPLATRIKATGIKVDDATSGPTIALCDGRTATQRARDDDNEDLVLVDLCLDFEKTARVAVARADQCSDAGYRACIGALQAAGTHVTRIDDVAGMAATRIVAMLINEAADVVTQGIATAVDIDTAMRLGTSYPRGPLAWSDELGATFVTIVLANLQAHYGDTRYRVSPMLKRLGSRRGRFHD